MQAGRDIEVMDSLIAATAWIYDKQMLTNDNHFNVVTHRRLVDGSVMSLYICQFR